MSDFRCPYYYWDGSQWRCKKSDDYSNLHDFDTYCTDSSRCEECPNYNK